MEFRMTCTALSPVGQNASKANALKGNLVAFGGTALVQC